MNTKFRNNLTEYRIEDDEVYIQLFYRPFTQPLFCKRMLNFSRYNLGEPVINTNDMIVYHASPKEMRKDDHRVIKVYNTNYLSLRAFDRMSSTLDIFHNSKHPYMENIIAASSKDSQGTTHFSILLPQNNLRNLYDDIKEHKEISATTKQKIAYSIAVFLKDLHKNGVSLPVLDSRAVTFDDNTVLITSASMDPKNDKFGIYPWFSPEKLNELSTPTADLFSLAVILREMECGQWPLNDCADKNEMMRLYKNGEKPELSDTPLHRIILKCLTPEEKPTADEVAKECLKTVLFEGADLEEVKKYAQSTYKTNNVKIEEDFAKHYSRQLKEKDELFLHFFASANIEKNENSSLKALKESADKGFPPAQYMYSEYIEGLDPKQSREYLSKSAQGGYISAFSKLAVVALSNKSVVDARALFKEAADMGDILSIRNYGQMLLIGAGGEQNREEAMKYLNNGVEQGDSACQFIVGSCLIEEGKNSEGMKLLILSGAQGNKRAQNAVAFDFADPRSPNYNTHAAMEILKDCIKDGSYDAMIRAGQILRNGEGGVEKDDKQATEYFKKAAEKGLPAACVEYAKALINGLGTEVNREKGLQILKLWAEHRHNPEAMLIYGQEAGNESMILESARLMYAPACIYLGKQKTGEEREKLFKTAADSGNPEGFLLYALEIKEKDPKKAQEYLEKAVQFHNADAEIELAIVRIENNDVQGGLETLQEKALEKNQAAMYAIGQLMIDGKYVEKNEKEGAHIIIEAARMGYQKAKKTAAELFRNGIGVDKDEGLAAEIEK